MWNRNIETFLGCDAPPEEASVILYGAPFDSTTSFKPGARFGSGAIRRDSWGLETYSPYQDRDLAEISVLDAGDLELPFGDSESALKTIEAFARGVFAAGKLPFLLGGEHLVTLGAVRAAAEKYPELHVVHFDAHTDLREEYLGAKLSHASVLRRCHDLLGDGRIHQFGIRSGEKAEFEWAKAHTDLHRFNLEGLAETVKALGDKPVYFTLDLDVLDPSVFWGTGTPEPEGISFRELREGIMQLKACNIVGCDAVELAPSWDPSGASTAVACKIVREMLLAFGK